MLRTEFVPSVEKRKWVMWVRCWVLPPPLSCLTRLDFSYHSSAALWPVHTHIWWVMKTETSLFSKLSFALFPPLLFFLHLFDLTCVCVCFAPSLSLCVCVFVSTERPKECVWWGDIGCTGASWTQEETQMCAAMRGCSPFQSTHTHHTHIHTS